MSREVLDVLVKRLRDRKESVTIEGNAMKDRCIHWMWCLPLTMALGATVSLGETFNVRDYGAKGDGVADDTAAIRDAVNAANNSPGANTVCFPKGVYMVANLPLTKTHKNPCNAPFLDKPLAHITLKGEGAAVSVLKRIPGQRDSRISTMNDASDVVVEDIGFDFNAIDRFGGFACYGGKRIKVRHCRFFDSAPTPPHSFDRMGIMAMGCEDLEITHNAMDEMQMEVDHCKRLRIVGNVVERPRETGGIGMWAHGGSAEDCLIQGNWIIDPSGVSAGAIVAHMDGVGPKYDNSSFKNVRILENVIVLGTKYKGAKRTTSPPAIKLGAPDNSQSYQNVVFDGITVQGNRIYVDPKAGIKVTECGLLFANASRKSGFVFDNLTVKDNTFYCAEDVPLMRIMQKGKNFVDENNVRADYVPPPKPPADL